MTAGTAWEAANGKGVRGRRVAGGDKADVTSEKEHEWQTIKMTNSREK